MGVDASTNSIAFCIFEGDKLVKYGEINFTGSDVFERLVDAKRKVHALREEFDVDFVCIEAAIKVRSVGVAIKMAYVFGAIIAEILDQGGRVVTVTPLEWQTYIGNTRFTAAQKAAVVKKNPGRSKSWIANEIRTQRKQRTADFFTKKFNAEFQTDNVSDAFGLAWYATHKLVD